MSKQETIDNSKEDQISSLIDSCATKVNNIPTEVIEQLKATDVAETHLFFTLTWYGTRNVLDHWTSHAKNKSLEFYEKFKKYCDKYNHPKDKIYHYLLLYSYLIV